MFGYASWAILFRDSIYRRGIIVLKGVFDERSKCSLTDSFKDCASSLG